MGRSSVNIVVHDSGQLGRDLLSEKRKKERKKGRYDMRPVRAPDDEGRARCSHPSSRDFRTRLPSTCMSDHPELSQC